MMADSASASQQRIRRMSRPKVRSGCITCKKRRVKCDETRPACLRCQNFGCSCDGYEFQITTQSSRVLRKRFLVPKIQGDVLKPCPKSPSGTALNKLLSVIQEGRAIRVKDGGPKFLLDQSSEEDLYDQLYLSITNNNSTDSCVIYSPSSAIFESDQDLQYFWFYCEKTANQLAGGYSDGIWNEVFLQACHDEPFVRCAIVAIAALSKAMEGFHPEANGTKSLRNIKNCFSENPHHVYALQQYGKSVKQMRNAIKPGDENIRMIMLSCLLTVCFESFHGNHENALVQIGAGLSVVHDWLKKHYPATSMLGLRSPNPYILDDRLFHAFIRLDIACMHFFDRRPSEFHREKSLEGFEVVKNMPVFFSNLEEASRHFAVVMNRALHIFKWVESKAVVHHHRKQMHIENTAIETSYPNRHINNVAGPRLVEIEAYLGELDRWNTAFQPIYDRSISPEYRMELVPASYLKMHQMLIFLLLNGLKSSEETRFDLYLPQFKEIVATAEALLGHPQLSHSTARAIFIFDPNIILPLLVVTIKCRDWVVRRKAIELLQKHPRREGTWDSSLAAGIGLWHTSLEERGLRNGEFVPEKNRVRIAGVKQDFEHRTAILSASQRVDGETIIHSTTINW